MHCVLGLSWPGKRTLVSAPEDKLYPHAPKLTGAIFPCTGVRDVDLARGMVVAQKHAWQDRDGVLPVVYVRHMSA